ncbi:mucin-3A-like [Watersipora subatra]|uniref:mucin-3A-like n=1 Tax=Watersipora subatra TaxID=2589382 RepID=UPI00355BF830
MASGSFRTYSPLTNISLLSSLSGEEMSNLSTTTESSIATLSLPSTRERRRKPTRPPPPSRPPPLPTLEITTGGTNATVNSTSETPPSTTGTIFSTTELPVSSQPTAARIFTTSKVVTTTTPYKSVSTLNVTDLGQANTAGSLTNNLPLYIVLAVLSVGVLALAAISIYCGVYRRKRRKIVKRKVTHLPPVPQKTTNPPLELQTTISAISNPNCVDTINYEVLDDYQDPSTILVDDDYQDPSAMTVYDEITDTKYQPLVSTGINNHIYTETETEQYEEPVSSHPPDNKSLVETPDVGGPYSFHDRVNTEISSKDSPPINRHMEEKMAETHPGFDCHVSVERDELNNIFEGSKRASLNDHEYNVLDSGYRPPHREESQKI